VGGAAGIDDGGGVIGPAGACANAPPANNNPTAGNFQNLLNCFMFFFPEAQARGILQNSFPPAPA
jgi:hypothetical protein